jgi:hypothetical protein
VPLRGEPREYAVLNLQRMQQMRVNSDWKMDSLEIIGMYRPNGDGLVEEALLRALLVQLQADRFSIVWVASRTFALFQQNPDTHQQSENLNFPFTSDSFAWIGPECPIPFD